MTIMDSHISIAADLLRMEAPKALALSAYEKCSNKSSVVSMLLPYTYAPRESAESKAQVPALPAYRKFKWSNKPSVVTWLLPSRPPREASESKALAIKALEMTIMDSHISIA